MHIWHFMLKCCSSLSFIAECLAKRRAAQVAHGLAFTSYVMYSCASVPFGGGGHFSLSNSLQKMPLCLFPTLPHPQSSQCNLLKFQRSQYEALLIVMLVHCSSFPKPLCRSH
uniref:Putative secreted protein ovary overexpressed n=1 Tax=Rhipicephalus microplus TaxID=6941 RepID=A0A6M2D9I5_RHIMP